MAQDEDLNFPNFSGLYKDMDSSQAKVAKFKCMWHYFNRISIRPPELDRHITMVLKEIPLEDLELISDTLWTSKNFIGSMTCVDQRIEDADSGYLQVS